MYRQKKLLFFLFLPIIALVGMAQQSQYAKRVYPIYVDPPTPCSENSMYYQMLTHKFYICKNTGPEEVGAGAASLPDANGTTRGALIPADWNTFNNKQPALGFTPENIANKNISNGYAGLDAGGKIPLARIAEVLASTDLTDYATTSGSGTTAIHSTISGASINDVLTWNGSNWINQAPLVFSVFGRNGVVTAQTGDYTAAQVTNAFSTIIANNLTLVAAPSNPSVGFLAIWADTTDKILKIKDNTGAVSLTIKPNTCTGTDKVSAISTTGTVICSADQTGAGGSGITTLNTLVATTQTFSKTNDTNVTLTITSATADHNFTLGWTGTLAKTRTLSQTVYTDQANTYGNFSQIFQAGNNFRLADPTVTSKTVQFDLSNITPATTHTVNFPDANSTTIQSSTAGANQFATAVSAQGVVTYTQPSFSNLSGSATNAQVPDILNLTNISNLTTNGFVKTSAGDGTLIVDTNTYLTGNQTITLSGNVTGSGATSITTTIANNVVTGAMIALGSDVSGDIMYYNGTDYVRLPKGTDGQILQLSSGLPSWQTASGTGDMILASIQTVTGAKTFNATKLIIGTNVGAPTVVANSFYIDTSDGKFYLGSRDGTAWHEIFEAGVSLVNLTSNITGVLPVANGGTNISSYTKGDVLAASGATTLIKLAVGTDGQCLKADSTQTSGLIYGACSGGGSGDVVGPSSATDNAVARFDTTTGKLIQNSGVTIDDSNNISTAGNISVGVASGLAGFIELTQGTAPSLGTTSVILAAPTSVTSYRIMYPSAAATGIPHFANSANVITMSISAINLAGADVTGILPTANIVNGTITNSKCLHVDGSGLISETGSDCGAGGGSPGGSDQEIQYNNASAFGGASNLRYNNANGRISTNQFANGNDTIYGARFTDTSPTGNFIHFQNAAAGADEFTVDVNGNVALAGSFTMSGLSITSAGNISTAGNISVGVGGTDAGFVELTQGAAPSLGTTSAIIFAPTSVTSYAIKLPTAAATGIGHFSNSSNIVTMSISAVDLASADVTGVLPVANGGSGAGTLTGILKGNGTSAFTVATAGTDYTSPSSTESFTNKTFDIEATGNLFTSPKKLWFDAAGCSGTTSGANFDLPTTSAPTATCTGTTTTVGALDFVDATTTGATRSFKLPSGFTGNVDINLIWFANSTSTNAVRWQVSTGCVADSEAVSTGPSYNTASASNEAYVGGTANLRDSSSFTNVAKTNCAADETMWVKVERVGGDGGDTLAATAELLGMEVIIRTAD